jgi:hypothetical protein
MRTMRKSKFPRAQSDGVSNSLPGQRGGGTNPPLRLKSLESMFNCGVTSCPGISAFDRPVILPDGKTLLTLEDARRHILALPKSDHETAAWQIAIEALVLAADVSRRGD